MNAVVLTARSRANFIRDTKGLPDEADLIDLLCDEIERITATTCHYPMGRDNDDDTFVTGYMDTVDFECELGLAAGGNRVYPSVEDLKANSRCWPRCGVVEVQVKAVQVTVPQNLFVDLEEPSPAATEREDR